MVGNLSVGSSETAKLLFGQELLLNGIEQMKFLINPPRYLFFTGKGGVGKTSIACATALQLSEEGRCVLLVSTDPASNVGQVFGVAIGNRIKALTNASPNLFALEIDPQAAARAYRDRIVGPVRGVLPDAVVKNIEEQLSGACTTEIAAFDEFTALLTDTEMAAVYDHIVFDTAPTGHTIRLLQLPSAWSGFLETSKGDASCLGPLSGLEKQRTQYKEAVEALSDPRQTRLVLVARAQKATLREVARTHEELSAVGLLQQCLVINGVLPSAEAEQDDLAAAIFEREQAALAAIPVTLQLLPRDLVSLKPFNLVGLDALCHLLNDIDDTPSTATGIEPPAARQAPGVSSLVDDIAAEGHGLIMFMGKGGVGKTTLAAAFAVELALRGLPVHLSTSDPAAHLSDTIEGKMDNLTVSRIDPHEETERYRQLVLETKGAHLDAEGRALLEEDLRSPCTEEIAVFQAFSKIIREADRKFVVMDTAPTGHTLLLLESLGYGVEGLRSKSWDEFAGPDAPKMDFIFTVCDKAAGEVCPAWPGQPITTHWGFPDPVAVKGSPEQKQKAFFDSLMQISQRIQLFLSLRIEDLDAMSLQNAVRELGQSPVN
jgi:arsenite/tail-anchored protein-transporting ATPase